jgi:lipid II:glycine glycyltransferase (peptidoglycan interpeptide bridge formation enzyme)
MAQPGLRVSLSESGIDPEWDAFVGAAPGGSHVQTTLWAAVKELVGWESARVVVRRGEEIVAGCQLLLRPAGPATLAYAPRGPLLADPSDLELFATTADGIGEIAGGRRLSYLKVQPPEGSAHLAAPLMARGFVRSDLEAAPIATTTVDLAAEPDDILARMRSTTRANIRKAGRKGVVVRTGGLEDIETFGALVHTTSERQGFASYPTPYYRRVLELFGEAGQATLLLAEYDGRTVSAQLILGWNNTAVYKMGAWSGEPANVRPNELGHWTAMLWARERGYRRYDLEGLPVPVAMALLRGEDPPEAHEGTARFKLGFGGEVHLFPPAFDTSPSRVLAPVVRRVAPRLRRWEAIALRALGRRRRDG